MKKKSFTKAVGYRHVTKSFLKEKRILKKQKNKKRRKSKEPKLIEKTTGAWNIV